MSYESKVWEFAVAVNQCAHTIRSKALGQEKLHPSEGWRPFVVSVRHSRELEVFGQVSEAVPRAALC